MAIALTTASAGPTAAVSPADGSAGDAELKLAESVISCTDIDSEWFCTELGFIEFQPGSAEWRHYLEVALSGTDSDTGDQSLASIVHGLAQLSRSELATRQREQISTAVKSVGKIKLMRYLGDRVSIPAGFFLQYPELGVVEGSALAQSFRAEAERGTVSADVGATIVAAAPTEAYIMSGYATEQEDPAWCGVATMQAIDWADDGGKDSQTYWASALGTTGAGTGIANIVAKINSDTNWDAAAGTYAVVSVTNATEFWFGSVHRASIGLYGAPVVEHVMLLRQYFSYLNFDHGGHFQTGRGYSSDANYISIIEPYNEARWQSGGASSFGYRSVTLSNLWQATRAHSMQNIGI